MIRSSSQCRWGKGTRRRNKLTGEARHGGLQIVVYPMKASKFQELQKESGYRRLWPPARGATSAPRRDGPWRRWVDAQEVYEDEYGFDVWCTSARTRCFVHVLNSIQFFAVSGVEPPRKPPYG